MVIGLNIFINNIIECIYVGGLHATGYRRVKYFYGRCFRIY